MCWKDGVCDRCVDSLYWDGDFHSGWMVCSVYAAQVSLVVVLTCDAVFV